MSTIHSHLLPLSVWTVENSNVNTKQRLIRENAMPTPAMIRQNLGSKLAEAVFSRLHRGTQALIGLDKVLDGPGEELWSQPKRQLMGELVMEPYPTRRHRQALTHQAIIDYGEKSMEEWENKMTAEKEESMKNQLLEKEEQMNEIFEMKLNQIRAKEREDFLIRIGTMEKRLEERHQREMEALRQKLTEEGEAKVAQIMETMKTNFECETDALLSTTEKMLTNRFNFRLNWMKADMEEDYHNKLSAETKLLEMKMKKSIDDKKCVDDDTLTDEMLSKVVCTACLTAEFLTKEFKERIEILKRNVIELNECNIQLLKDLEYLENMNNMYYKEISAWECVIKDVVIQFQKFVEFHMKHHGESSYLISWDKILDKKNEIVKAYCDRELEESSISIKASRFSETKKQISESFSFYESCNQEIISIISSIIKRVIPSQTNLNNPVFDIRIILDDIIKKVIPSSIAVAPEETPEKDSFQRLVIKPCPRSRRLEYTRNKDTKKTFSLAAARSSRKINIPPPQENLSDRILEINEILKSYPNVMKFIQGS